MILNKLKMYYDALIISWLRKEYVLWSKCEVDLASILNNYSWFIQYFKLHWLKFIVWNLDFVTCQMTERHIIFIFLYIMKELNNEWWKLIGRSYNWEISDLILAINLNDWINQEWLFLSPFSLVVLILAFILFGFIFIALFLFRCTNFF